VGAEEPTLSRRLAAEAIGTTFLLAAVVGSGIMGERLAAGNVAVALLANSLATGAALVALILVFARVSGAHLNPIVSLVQAARGRLPYRGLAGYVVAQVVGAFVGVALAHGMFGDPIFAPSTHARSGSAQGLSEVVATIGLVTVVWGTSRLEATASALAVAGYITSAYWFTASTCFANPAVTLARAATDTFTGIRPADVPLFIGAQVVGAGGAVSLLRWLFDPTGTRRRAVADPTSSVR
jgi:glycerol uptake facilitator-like aquaporin